MTIEPIAVVAPVLVEHTETLPRKRMASAVLFHDGHGRQLLVAPVYKEGWELPGGCVEDQESLTPQRSARSKKNSALP